MVVTNTLLESIRTDVINSFSSYDYLGVGDGTTPPNASNTQLVNELLRKNILVDDISLDTNNGTYTITIRINPPELVGDTINEIGLFDASSSGNMFSRNLTNSYIKTNDKEVLITLEISVEVLNN